MDETVTSAAGVAAVAGWTVPGVFGVAPGVHRIPLPPNDALLVAHVHRGTTGYGPR